MLTVYAIPVSLYCAKLRILLRHKGLVWRELAPPGGYGSDEYKQIVPSGNLPALDDDGLLIADSEAIAEYLNEKFSDPPMLPGSIDDRAKAREFSRFHDTRLEPELRKLFAHIGPGARDRQVATKQSLAINDRLVQLGRLLEDAPEHPAGDLGLGDCGYPITFTWIELLKPVLGLTIDWPAEVTVYHDLLGKIPAVHDELASYRQDLEAWLAARLAA